MTSDAEYTAVIASLTLLLLQRGCPDELLDAAWVRLVPQEPGNTPWTMVRQLDKAIADARADFAVIAEALERAER